MVQIFPSRFSMVAALCLGSLALAGCQQTPNSTTSENESAQQIIQRAQEIQSAADAAVNQQIEDINAAAGDRADDQR